MSDQNMDELSPVILEQRYPDAGVVQSLRKHGVDPMLAALYSARGVTDIKEIRGNINDILHPSSMKNCLEMASLLADYMVLQKRVLIVSDYDCDGATACATLLAAFHHSGMNVDYLVPDRKKDGYGLTESIVREAADMPIKPDVIITVDSGISSHDGINLANSLGIEVLVTDHHLSPAELPNAKLIVNPNQPGCGFESKSIAGCGVAWYIAKAFADELVDRGYELKFHPNDLLQFTTIGTVADVVGLDKNNRILVREGLRRIRSAQCTEGVKALIAASDKWFPALTCADIGFGLAPRLNAAGRLGHMALGVELLMSTKSHLAAEMAGVLNRTNAERKEIEKRMTNEAKVLMDSFLQKVDFSNVIANKSIVVHGENWHEGVVGIVASRIKEEKNRPSFVICEAEDGTFKGSGRSIEGFHLKHALDEISVKYPGILEKHGGHAMAVGATIAAGRLDDFRAAFEEVCAAQITPGMLQKKVRHDGELNISYFEPNFVRRLNEEVWGQGFPEPTFIGYGEVVSKKSMGDENRHLRVDMIMGDLEVKGVAFNHGERAKTLPSELAIIYKPAVDRFGEEDAVQVMIDHLPTDEMVADYKQKNEAWKAGNSAIYAIENFTYFGDEADKKSSSGMRP
jgi:single-stranded-DNA-specific exonuclease